MTKEISGGFQTELLKKRGVVVVQFKTDWNGACQIMAPVMKELAEMYRDAVTFYTVDMERNPGLSGQYGVMELPTVLFFNCGQLIDHFVGLAPKSTVITKIETALSNNQPTTSTQNNKQDEKQ